MTTIQSNEPRSARGAVLSSAVRRGRIPFTALIIGALGLLASGGLHPRGDDGIADKTDALHAMFVDRLWYASHGLWLAALIAIAYGVWQLGRGTDLHVTTRKSIVLLTPIFVLSVFSMGVHLLLPLGADQLSPGNAGTYIASGTEIVCAFWGLALAAVALVAGRNRDLGNPYVAILGVAGGVVSAIFHATIPFTDAFDKVAPVGGLLITLWLVVVGGMGLFRLRRIA